MIDIFGGGFCFEEDKNLSVAANVDALVTVGIVVTLEQLLECIDIEYAK